MRVLFSSTWGVGHVFPMVPLARAFLAAGHDVLWATYDDALTLVADAGIPVVRAGADAQGVESMRQRLATATRGRAPNRHAGIAFPLMFGEWAAPAMAEDLLPVARDWDPDVMIHEPAELAAPLVAAAVGVPTVTHAYGTAVPRRFLAAAAVRLRPLWAAHGVSTPPLAAMLRATYADICPPSMQPRLPTHARRVLLRPVPYSGAAAWTDDLEASALPLVYVTLGTVYSNADTLTRAAAGLHDLPVRAVVTVGPGRDPGELGYQPAQVRVVRWVPQAAIVPLSSVVVSHCGSGTFLTALAHGKPQLALPQSADQFRNAKALVRRGAGLALLPGDVNPQAVASAVQRLLHEEHFAAAARDVAAEISAMPAPDVVVSTLENSYPSKVRK